MDFKEGTIIAIDKPYGMSSFGALARVRTMCSRKACHKVKIGHAGTLDPLATGVLVLCTGKMTKRIEEMQSHDKEYEATLQLGASTPSHDMEHDVDKTYPTEHLSLPLIEETLGLFVGDIQQVPPSYSACKINGQRAYDLKRKGRDVELSPKDIHIESIDILRYDDASKQLTIKVNCGKGTYIRALARDLGKALGSGAYLTALRRTRVGDIKVSDCIALDAFESWLDKQEYNI